MEYNRKPVRNPEEIEFIRGILFRIPLGEIQNAFTYALNVFYYRSGYTDATGAFIGGKQMANDDTNTALVLHRVANANTSEIAIEMITELIFNTDQNVADACHTALLEIGL